MRVKALVTLILAMAAAAPGELIGQPNPADDVRAVMEKGLEELKKKEAALEAQRLDLQRALEQQESAEVDVRRAIAELRDRSFALAENVRSQARISPSTLPGLVERLEQEQLSLDMEKIGLDARIEALAEAIGESRSEGDSIERNAELQLHKAELDMLRRKYEKMKHALQDSDEAEDALDEMRLQLEMAEVHTHKARARAEAARGQGPDTAGLTAEMRRAVIELRVVEAKRQFVRERLLTMHEASRVASEFTQVQAQLDHQQSRRFEQAQSMRERLDALRDHLSKAENERKQLMDVRTALQKQLEHHERLAAEQEED